MKFYFRLFLLFISFSALIYSQETPETYQKAMKAFDQGRFIEAYSLFESIITDYKMNDELYSSAKFYSSESLLYLDQLDNAIAGYEFFVYNYKWSIFREKALSRLSSIFYNKRNYLKVLEYSDILVKEFPYSQDIEYINYLRGDSYLQLGKYDDAIGNLKLSNNRINNPYADRSLFGLGTAYEKINDYETAIKYYDTLLTYHANSFYALQAQTRIGICYFKLKDYEASILELSNPLLTNLPADKYSNSLYMLANSYYRSGDYNNAIKSFSEIRNNFGGTELGRSATYGLAWAYFQLKDYESSYAIFDSLSNSGNNDTIAVNSFFRKAQALRYLGSFPESEDLFNQFVQKYPNNIQHDNAMYEIALIKFRLNKFDEAKEIITGLSSSNDSLLIARSKVLFGEILVREGDYSGAINYFTAAKSIAANNAEIKNTSSLGDGISLFYLKQYNESIKVLSQLLSSDVQDNEKIQFFIAEDYFMLEKYNEAISNYNSIDPGNDKYDKEILYAKGYSYLNLKDYDTAGDIFNDFLRKYSNDKKASDVRLRLADSYYGNKNYTAAIAIYKDVLQSEKDKANSPADLYQYGQILFRGGRSQEAIEQLNILRQKYPDSEYSVKSLFLIGWINFRNENYDEAINKYKQVIMQYPENNIIGQTYYSIGDAYYNKESYDSAIVYYGKVISNYPNSSIFLDAVSGIQYSYEAKGQPDKAAQYIDDFILKNSTSKQGDQLLYKKNEILYNSRLYDLAKTGFQEFILKYPDSKLVPDAYYMLSKTFLNLHKDNEMIQNLKYIMANYPLTETAYNSVIDLGNYYNQIKNYDSAIAAYDFMLNANPQNSKNAELTYLKGLNFAYKQDYNGALDVFATVLQNYSSTEYCDKSMFEIAQIEAAAENYEFPEKYYKYLGENRQDELGAKSLYNYGVVLAAQKKYDEALDAYSRTINKFTGFEEWTIRSYMKMADIYIETKVYDKAKEVLRTVIKKHPKDLIGKEAQKKLESIR